MTIFDFMPKWEGKYADFDGVYGPQCVDICKYWEQFIGAPITHGNGKDYKINATEKPNDYQWVKNTATSIPVRGDIIVWGSGIGNYGHVAIYIRGDVNKFWSFDQNFPVGSKCHVQEHSYNAVIGYLRPKVLATPPPTPVDPKDTLISQLEKKVQMLETEIEQLKRDKNNLIKGSQDKVTEITLLKKKNKAITKLYDDKVIKNNELIEMDKNLRDEIVDLRLELSECKAKLAEKPTGEQPCTFIEWIKQLFNRKD